MLCSALQGRSFSFTPPTPGLENPHLWSRHEGFFQPKPSLLQALQSTHPVPSSRGDSPDRFSTAQTKLLNFYWLMWTLEEKIAARAQVQKWRVQYLALPMNSWSWGRSFILTTDQICSETERKVWTLGFPWKGISGKLFSFLHLCFLCNNGFGISPSYLAQQTKEHFSIQNILAPLLISLGHIKEPLLLHCFGVRYIFPVFHTHTHTSECFAVFWM